MRLEIIEHVGPSGTVLSAPAGMCSKSPPRLSQWQHLRVHFPEKI